jgi:hypothetical protein
MAADANLWTGTVGHCAVAILMQSFCYVAEESAAPDGSLPCRFVHSELLEVFQVHDYGIVLAADT